MEIKDINLLTNLTDLWKPNKHLVFFVQMHLWRKTKSYKIPKMRRVELVRDHIGFGFCVIGEGPCQFSSIMKGSPAEKAGLKTDDLILCINDINVSQAKHEVVIHMVEYSSHLVLGVINKQKYLSLKADHSYSEYMKPSLKAVSKPLSDMFDQVCRGSLNPPLISLEDKSPALLPGSKYSQHSIKPPQEQSRMDGMKQDWLDQFSSARYEFNSNRQTNQGSPQIQQILERGISAQNHRKQKVKCLKNLHEGRHKHPSDVTYYRELNRDEHSHGDISQRNRFQSFNNCECSWTPKAENCQFIVLLLDTVILTKIPVNSIPHIQQVMDDVIRKANTSSNIHAYVFLNVNEIKAKIVDTRGHIKYEHDTRNIVQLCQCVDDDTYFAIVTQDLESKCRRMEPKVVYRCHVFQVDKLICNHRSHLVLAKHFKISCHLNLDMSICQEFPISAKFVLQSLRKLCQHQADKISAENVNLQQGRNPSGSNICDSGYGDSTDNVKAYVVDVGNGDMKRLEKVPSVTRVIRDDLNNTSVHAPLLSSSYFSSSRNEVDDHVPNGNVCRESETIHHGLSDAKMSNRFNKDQIGTFDLCKSPVSSLKVLKKNNSCLKVISDYCSPKPPLPWQQKDKLSSNPVLTTLLTDANKSKDMLLTKFISQTLMRSNLSHKPSLVLTPCQPRQDSKQVKNVSKPPLPKKHRVFLKQLSRSPSTVETQERSKSTPPTLNTVEEEGTESNDKYIKNFFFYESDPGEIDGIDSNKVKLDQHVLPSPSKPESVFAKEKRRFSEGGAAVKQVKFIFCLVFF